MSGFSTDQFSPESRRRKFQEIVPLPHERTSRIAPGGSRMRYLCAFNQRWVATDLPRNEPMHHQLRDIVHRFLVDRNLHVPSDFKKPDLRPQTTTIHVIGPNSNNTTRWMLAPLCRVTVLICPHDVP